MKKYILKLLASLMSASIILSCTSLLIFANGDEQEKITHVKGSNSASTSYAAGKYYKYLTSLPLTGDNITDLMAVAFSQLGYMESDSVDDMSGTTGGRNNFTEFNYNMGDFGVGYGTGNYDWCASFVSYCLLQSHSTTQNSMNDWCRKHVADENSPNYDPEYSKYIWREVGCQRWADNLASAGYYRASAANAGEYQPKTGDLIFFRWSPEKQIGHIGIVVYSDSERVYTVEGNTSGGTTMVSNGGGVYFKSYALDYSCIDGYGEMPYAANDEVKRIDYSGNNASVGMYMATTDKYLYSDMSVESSYTVLPAYTMFNVVDVVEEGIGGMLLAECEIDGETVSGYIVNSSTDRVVQLTTIITEPDPESFLDFDKTEGFISGEIGGYTLNGENISADAGLTVEGIGRIVLSGRFDFEDAVVRGGYYLDGARENIFWVDGSISTDGTSGGKKCDIWVDIYGLSEGEHSLTFVLELGNRVITVVDTLSFTFANKKEVETDAESDVQKPTDEVTETPTGQVTEDPQGETPSETDVQAFPGCSSAFSVVMPVLLVTLASVLAVRRKIRED